MQQFPPEPQENDDEPLDDLDIADDDYERAEPPADDPETWVEFLSGVDDMTDEDALHGTQPKKAKSPPARQSASKKKKPASKRKPASKGKPAAKKKAAKPKRALKVKAAAKKKVVAKRKPTRRR